MASSGNFSSLRNPLDAQEENGVGGCFLLLGNCARLGLAGHILNVYSQQPFVPYQQVIVENGMSRNVYRY